MQSIQVTDAERDLIEFLRYIDAPTIFTIMILIADGQRSALGQKPLGAFRGVKSEFLREMYFEASNGFKTRLERVWVESEFKRVDL